MIHLSVVSPVYRAATILPELVKQITETAVEIAGDNYEIVLVEDFGPDNSREVISEICAKDPHVKGVFLSRNFGQQYAINAGLDYAQGEWVVTMDCDLQDTPAAIHQLYNRAQEGYDIVYASRQERQDGFLKKFASKKFNDTMSYLTGIEQDGSIANFVLYHRKAVDAMKSMSEYRRYYPLMNHWIGFRQYTEPIPHAERADELGSSYSWRKRINLAIETIIAFSDKPLRLMIYLGLMIMLFAFLGVFAMIINYIVSDVEVSGWLTTIASLWIIAGLIIIMLGLVGAYVGKTFEATKRRPTYIVQETLNVKK